MRIEVDVTRCHDWELRHKDAVGPEDVSMPSHHGPDLRMVRLQRDGPTTTFIDLPDADIERMVEDHQEAVRVARAGYTAIHVGGPMDGQEVVVPPRLLPEKTRNQLVADHIGGTVMPYHAPAEHIRRVRIVDSGLDPEDQARLERHLHRQLAVEDDEAASPAAAEETAG